MNNASSCQTRPVPTAGIHEGQSSMYLFALTVLSVLVLIVLLPTTAFAATVTSQLDFSSMLTSSSAADGWAWDATTQTLTLTNFDMQYPGASTIDGAINLPAGATVVLQGTNTIDITTDQGIGLNGATGDLTIEGPGTLNATGYQPIFAQGNLTIDNGAVINATSEGLNGGWNTISANANITISNATVNSTATGDGMSPLSAFSTVTIEGASTVVNVDAQGAYATGIQGGGVISPTVTPGFIMTGGTVNVTSLGDPTSLGIYAFGSGTVSGGVLNITASANGIDTQDTLFTGGVTTVTTTTNPGAWAIDGVDSLVDTGMYAAQWDGTNFNIPVVTAYVPVYDTIFGASTPPSLDYTYVTAADPTTAAMIVRVAPSPAQLLNYNTITFMNGATVVSSSQLANGLALGALPAAPIKPGYTFSGWFSAATGGTQIAASTVPTANSSYYAQWVANPAPAPAPVPAPAPAPTPKPVPAPVPKPAPVTPSPKQPVKVAPKKKINSDASLKAMKYNHGRLCKEFKPNRTSYTLHLCRNHKEVKITPKPAQKGGKVQVKRDGKWKTVEHIHVNVKRGKSKEIRFRVVAPDKKTSKTYKVKVVRAS